MKYILERIAPVRAGIVAGVLHALIGLVLLPICFILFILGPGPDAPSLAFAGVFVLVVPIFYGGLGFVTMAGFCWLYNIVARRIGGIKYTASPVEEAVRVPPVRPGFRQGSVLRE